ncbi:hypothetical protein DEU56DRAFT_947119 [Suillus clintonianus]|uniref:uncharacterized protein n=1 Tax=Suillus clintonianus TaxID=1904413 RepID=UPI001B86D228|nr:uncharacterized protein DEU56DRAFT_947119 [Suillus clintonianus]KAG2135957.1 hypothetical protein DEU56DRAFT_947119 [Suillus clintonianus]
MSAIILAVASEYYCNPSLAVAFLRACQSTYWDHFYTTNVTEMKNAETNLGYILQGDAAYVFTTDVPSTTPLYRMYNPSVVDYFYTTSWSEVESAEAEADSNYTLEEIAAYVYDINICGSIPLYRLYSSKETDHFYTTSVPEVLETISKGYTLDGIKAYVLPVPS